MNLAALIFPALVCIWFLACTTTGMGPLRLLSAALVQTAGGVLHAPAGLERWRGGGTKLSGRSAAEGEVGVNVWMAKGTNA